MEFLHDPVKAYNELGCSAFHIYQEYAVFLGMTLTGDHFFQIYELAKKRGLEANFKIADLKQANHPNFVLIKITGVSNSKLIIEARSIGGGMINITRLNRYNLLLTGKAWEYVIVCPSPLGREVIPEIKKINGLIESSEISNQLNQNLIRARFIEEIPSEDKNKLESLKGVEKIWTCSPVFFPPKGKELFVSTAEILSLSEKQSLTLGELALAYESNLLGISELYRDCQH